MPGEGGLTGDTLRVGERIGYAECRSRRTTPPPIATRWSRSVSSPIGCTSTRGSPPRIVPGPDSARPWPPATPGTRSSAPDLTASPGLAPASGLLPPGEGRIRAAGRQLELLPVDTAGHR